MKNFARCLAAGDFDEEKEEDEEEEDMDTSGEVETVIKYFVFNSKSLSR